MMTETGVSAAMIAPLQTGDLLTAYNGILVRMGLYILIFWPTVGYYVYQDSIKRGLLITPPSG